MQDLEHRVDALREIVSSGQMDLLLAE
jgi:hypothetical protein